MASIGNVVQRRGIFHFRRVVPTDLRIRIGRCELVRSLATGDPRDAKMRASQLYLVSERLFVAVRRDPMLTDAQLAGLVQAFFVHVLEEENRRRLSGSYLTAEVREARRDYWDAVAAKSKESLACNRLEDASWVAEAMLRKQRLPRSSLSQGEIAQVKQAMLRAGVDLAEALKARYDGNFNYDPRDKLLKLKLAEAPQLGGPAATPAAATTVQQTVAPGPLMSDAGKAFRERQVATKSWDLQTSAQASMASVLHGSARTTPRIRAELQASKESARSLAARYDLNPKTVRKWRQRTTTADAPMGPKAPKSTVLTPAEEAIVVAFRQKTLLPLDDVLGCLRDTIPNLSRSALHRCLQRHGISRLPKRRGQRASATGSRATRSAMSTSTAANCDTPTASWSCSWRSTGSRNSPTSSSTTAPERRRAQLF